MSENTYVAKQLLITELETNLRDKLTVADMELFKETILHTLMKYDVSRIANDMDAVAISQDLLQMYIDAKAAEGRSQKTLTRYQYILNKFLNSMNVSVLDVTVYTIRNYFKKEQARGVSNSTIAGERSIIKSFYTWLFQEELITKNPCINVGAIKIEQKVRKSFDKVEISKILEACTNARDKAIILFLLNTGCRISELCGLLCSDFNFEKNECVVNGKGSKWRMVFFDDVTRLAIADYLDETANLENRELFLSKRHKALTPGGVRRMLKILEERSGVKNIHPHRFRRTFATNMKNHGMPVEEIKALLGHSDMDTTLRYIYQTKETTKNAYFQYIH